MISALLTIERVVHMFVQELTFDGKSIVFPLLVKVNKSPLSGTKPVVLYPRQHEHIVFVVYQLYQLFYRDIFRNAIPVYCHLVIIEGTRSAIAGFLNLNQIKQLIGRRITEICSVLEDYQFLCTH